MATTREEKLETFNKLFFPLEARAPPLPARANTSVPSRRPGSCARGNSSGSDLSDPGGTRYADPSGEPRAFAPADSAAADRPPRARDDYPRPISPAAANSRASRTTKSACPPSVSHAEGTTSDEPDVAAANVPRRSKLSDDEEAAKPWNWNLYRAPPQRWAGLTDDEMRAAVFESTSLNAPGPEGVAFLALKELWPVIGPRICDLYRRCIALGYHPRAWKHQLGVILRKPNKPSYRIPKAYRIISLLPTIAKGLEKVIARRLAFYGARGALPAEHMGGRPGRSCEEAITGMLDHIRHEWRNGRRVLMFSTDMKNAFPNVSPARLLSILRRRGVPTELLGWLESFLSDRTVSLIVDGVRDEQRGRLMGLPQGSPLSPILFLFFNADLIEALRAPWARVVGWIDDVPPMVSAASTAQLVRRAGILARRAEGWAQANDVEFEGAKGEATIFTLKHDDLDGAAPDPVTLQGQAIPYVDQPTYLGYKLDRKLSPKVHVNYCAQRGAQAWGAIGRLTASRGGVRASHARRAYEACVVPRLLYASSAWFIPGRGKGLLAALDSVQRAAAAKISGAWRISGLAAMEVESDLLPMELRLRQRSFDFALRLSSAGPDHPLVKQIARASKRVTLRHASHLALLLHAYPSLQGVEVEKIASCPLPPWLQHDRPQIRRALSREQGLADHLAATGPDSDPTHLHLYTDGSRLDSGHAGAGYVLRTLAGTWLAGHLPMGRLRTVYEAEIYAIAHGLRMVTETAEDDVTEVHVWVDNQAALVHSTVPKRAPGQQFTYAARLALDDFRQRLPDVPVVFHWVPSHEDAEGNELADVEANKGAALSEANAAAPTDAPEEALPLDLDLGLGLLVESPVAVRNASSACVQLSGIAASANSPCTTRAPSRPLVPGRPRARATRIISEAELEAKLRGEDLANEADTEDASEDGRWRTDEDDEDSGDEADDPRDPTFRAPSTSKSALRPRSVSSPEASYPSRIRSGASAIHSRRARSVKTVAPGRALLDWRGDGALPAGASTSELRAEYRAWVKAERSRRWLAHTTGKAHRQVDPRPPGDKSRLLHLAELHRRHVSILSQLRVGRSQLNGDRYKCRLAPSPACACGAPWEDRSHYLLACPLYQAQRRALRRDLRKSGLSLALLGDAKATLALITYINSTERFPAFFAPVSEDMAERIKGAKPATRAADL